MTLKELKTEACRSLRQWCNKIPDDGDYRDPEIITDRISGQGNTPADGDYVVIMIFHNRKEAQHD